MLPQEHTNANSPATIITFLIALLLNPIPSTAGEYLQSAHGTSAQRPALIGAYAIGNCGHCHEQHGSIAELSAANGPFVYLEAENEEDLCFACHDSSEANGAPDIDTDVTTSNNKGHLVQNYSNIHRTNETLSDIANNGKHIECTDCHNPHRAKATLHTPGTTGNAILTDGPLTEVTGADPDYFSTTNKYGIWVAPPQNDYVLQQPATKEYQICFKCHSGSVGNPETWRGGSSSDPANTTWEWTDVGLDFSPYNRSGHPVVAQLHDYVNAYEVDPPGSGMIPNYNGLHNVADGTSYDQLLDTWDNPDYQTMYCSDCHKSSDANGDDTYGGPHGSSTKWMLAGPNQAWPFLTADDNGQSYIESSTYQPYRRLQDICTDIGSKNGVFCANCHPVGNDICNSSTPTNDVHNRNIHQKGRCVDCHIRVPHGGKVSRLIAAVDYSTYDGHLPDRLTATGKGTNAEGTTEPVVRLFHKFYASDYNNDGNSCYAPSFLLYNNTGSECGDFHSSTDTTSPAETW